MATRTSGERLAAQTVPDDEEEDKKLPATVEQDDDGSGDNNVHQPLNSTTTAATNRATANDAVAAAKAHLRNTGDDFTLGAWAVIERGSDISVTARDRALRSNHTGGLQEMEEGVSEHDTNHELFEEYGAGLDLKFEEYGAPNEAGLARAEMIDETDDAMDPAYLPAGLEFDPDAKPAELTRRHERYRAIRFYSLVAAALALIVVLGGVIAWQNRSVSPDALFDRAVLGIREYVLEQLLSAEDAERVVKDPLNPYSRALDWMQNVDAMALTPHNGTKFTQRFLAAYLYFSTSVYQPWASGCEPSSNSVNNSSSTTATPDGANNSYSTCQFTVTTEEYTNTRGGSRWLSSEGECHWGGVTCDSIGNIISLQLSGANLTGAFPEGIAGFRFLGYLSLSRGMLSGPLPGVVGEMKNLIFLDLFGNRFTGSIPHAWYKSRSLQWVDLRGNALTGSISEEIANWKDMRELFLSDNALTASIPSAMGEMKSLYDFVANNNALTGTIPAVFTSHLRNLGLGRNQLNGTIPPAIARRSLWTLSLAYNELTGTIPTEMSMLSDLTELDLSHNQLTGGLLPIASMTELGYARLNNNQFNGTLPTELGRLTVMLEFIASGNNFVGTVPRKICNLVAEDSKGSKRILEELQLDCGVTVEGALAEISCPVGCCTQCCDSDGMNCRLMLAD